VNETGLEFLPVEYNLVSAARTSGRVYVPNILDRFWFGLQNLEVVYTHTHTHTIHHHTCSL